MKKLLRAFIFACLAGSLCLAGCSGGNGPSSQQNEPPASMTDNTLPKMVSGVQYDALDENVQEQPVGAGCLKYTEGGMHNSFTYGEEAVEKLRDYLDGIEVGDETDVAHSDAAYIYMFYYSDGRTVDFHFEPEQVKIDGKSYQVLQSRNPVPEFAGDETMLADFPPSPAMQAFFDKLHEQRPTRVDMNSPMGEGWLIDALEVDAYCSKFGSITLYGAYPKDEWAAKLESSSYGKTEFTFTWPDGKSYTFYFDGDYLRVDFPDPELGEWGYYVKQFPLTGHL